MTVEWIALGLLVLVSASMSASETALFALDEEQRERSQPRVKRLLAEPRGLLVTVLVSNLVVNLLFFALASNLAPPELEYGDLIYGFGALVVLVVCSEILPKAIALRTSFPAARLLSLPLVVLVVVLKPVRIAAGFCLEIATRALGEFARPERGITTESLADVLESSARGGLIEASEADLLAEVVELEGIAVREIMTPRVDAILLDLDDPDEGHEAFVVARALARRMTWIPAVRGSPDTVAGLLRVRDLLAQPERPVAELVRPVVFVPEVANVLALLHLLRDTRAAEAVVVDEHGGTAGIVTIENVFEEIVGDLRVEGELTETPVERLPDGRFRVAGSLSIRDWNEWFGREVVPAGYETVGGLVMALLGRIPRAGDRVRVGDLVTQVHEVRGRRVRSVDMYLEPEATS